MRERFSELMRRACHKASDADIEVAYDELVRLYTQAWRAYHTLDHVAKCLARFDEVVDALNDPDAVEMALWYHDAIYELCSDSNEADSAELFVKRIGPLASPSFVVSVRQLILVTEYPSVITSDDQAHMTDIDLHSFGLPWDAFARDGEAVRAEFPTRSDEAFYRGQRRFMQQLMDTGHFYRSPYFKVHYERQARANLARYLELHPLV